MNAAYRTTVVVVVYNINFWKQPIFLRKIYFIKNKKLFMSFVRSRFFFHTTATTKKIPVNRIIMFGVFSFFWFFR